MAHFDFDLDLDPEKIHYALNRFLTRDIRLYQVEMVGEDFHARKSALGKHYSYTMYLGKNPPAIGHATFCPLVVPISPKAFFDTLSPLLGKHDFKGFCGRGSGVNNYERTLYSLALDVRGEWMTLHLVGNGFLRKMIRNIVGTGVDVVLGRRPANAISTCLKERDRTKGGQTAPSTGLVLESVFYEKDVLQERIEALKDVTYFKTYLTLGS